MPTQKTLREIIQEIILQHTFGCDCLCCRKDGKLDSALSEIKSLIKGKLPSSIKIRDLIRKHQIDIGQHRYTDMDRKEIRECCNVDQNDVALAFITEIEKIVEEV